MRVACHARMKHDGAGIEITGRHLNSRMPRKPEVDVAMPTSREPNDTPFRARRDGERRAILASELVDRDEEISERL